MGKYKPFILLGPGDSIREELKFYGWDQKDLAEILGISEKHVSQLLNNKVPITIDMAKKLSQVFKQSPQFWLNLDNNYRLRLEEKSQPKEPSARALIYRYMPIREMKKKGWLSGKKEDLVAEVNRFWNIKTLNFDFLERKAEVYFRKSDVYQKFNQYFALTWLQKAKNIVSEVETKYIYDVEKLNQLANRISDHTVMDNGVDIFLSELLAAGIFFIYLSHLEKTYTDGAVFWHCDNPVIVYTARYDRTDNFWWTIAHEIGHILKHHGKQEFIDSLDHLDMGDEKEKEADEFARRILRANEIERYFSGMLRVSRKKVEECAVFLGVHPGIVVGCLQHKNQIAYNTLNEFKEPVKKILDDYK